MSVKADSLRSMGFSAKVLEATVKEQLRIIDNLLLSCDKKLGWNVVKHPLPESFSVPGIDNPAEQQRFVYSHVVTSLQKRNFTTKLWLRDGQSFVLIGFNISFSQEQIDAMNDVLRRSNLDTEEELEKFIDGKGIKGAQVPKNSAFPTGADDGAESEDENS